MHEGQTLPLGSRVGFPNKSTDVALSSKLAECVPELTQKAIASRMSGGGPGAHHRGNDIISGAFAVDKDDHEEQVIEAVQLLVE